ncbi:MAG: BrnA antitoxin family protein [Acidobacteria bacterium]|nr:BrnA antitoxin family protein [Acidobacteriota bacterium]
MSKVERDKEEGVDPLPDQFSSDEEAADFWGGHDTAEYPEAFEAEGVVVEAAFHRRHFEAGAAPRPLRPFGD